MRKMKMISAIGFVVLLAVGAGAFASIPATRANDAIQPSGLSSQVCDNLQVPRGNELAKHLYAKGVQIYRWNGTSWSFVAPDARLFADANYQAEVGMHYAGPTWESYSGSKVKASRVDGCTADPTAIDWLKLRAVETSGPGVFSSVTYILRVNTTGGKAPATPGSTVGEIVNVPYTAEYLFYQSED